MHEKIMLSVKGKFRDGVAQPAEPIEGRNGQTVIITFLEENKTSLPVDNSPWEALIELIENCAVETGISDLAQQHDHYLYNKPKQE